MDDLPTWLRAQLDEDERKANSWYKVRPDAQPVSSRHHHDYVEVSVAGGPWREMSEAEYVESFTVPNPDQRLLREVEAKRKIVNFAELAMWDRVLGPEEQETWAKLRYVLELTALPFSDRPGYREEWKP